MKGEFQGIREEIQERVEELQDDFSLFFNNLEFSFESQYSSASSGFFDNFGKIATIVGGIAGSFFGPLGWAIGGLVGAAVGFFAKLFGGDDGPSEAEKARAAQARLERKLLEKIKKIENHSKKEVMKQLEEMLSRAQKIMDDHMNLLIKSSKSVYGMLQKEIKDSSEQFDRLNKGFLIRVLQEVKIFPMKKELLKALETEGKSILGVERDFREKSLRLKTDKKIDETTRKRISELICLKFSCVSEGE